MRPVTVVVSLPVTDVDRSSRFYRDGLGLAPSDMDESIVAFELPNLSLFLIEHSHYMTYTDHVGVRADSVPAAGACVISCAMGSKEAVDDTLTRAGAAGGSVARPADDHEGSYIGYFSDPDGHVWELVFNSQTEAAAAS